MADQSGQHFLRHLCVHHSFNLPQLVLVILEAYLLMFGRLMGGSSLEDAHVDEVGLSGIVAGAACGF